MGKAKNFSLHLCFVSAPFHFTRIRSFRQARVVDGMPIFRHKWTANFTIIPNSLIRNSNLKTQDKGLLIHILSLPEDKPLTVQYLCSIEPGNGKDSINSSLKRIEKEGYLRRVPQRDENGRLGKYVWYVSDRPDYLSKAD